MCFPFLFLFFSFGWGCFFFAQADSYEDVTDRLKEQCQTLVASGQTVEFHFIVDDKELTRFPSQLMNKDYTMEDAMHAWEVLNPKMDSGVGYASVKVASEVS